MRPNHAYGTTMTNSLSPGRQYVVGAPAPYHNLRWSKKKARGGEEVRLLADTRMVPEGQEVTLEIFEKDQTTRDDFVESLTATVEHTRLEATWQAQIIEDSDDQGALAEMHEKGYTAPEYYFIIRDNGSVYSSGIMETELLHFRDDIEYRLVDEEGVAVAGARYIATLPDRRRIEGETDGDGWARVEDVPPGVYHIRFPDFVGGLGGGPDAQAEAGVAATEATEAAPVQAEEAPTGAEGEDGQAAVSNCRWLDETGADVQVARAGDSVVLAADVSGSPDGTSVELEIHESDEESEDDLVTSLTGTVEGGQVQATWTYVYTDDEDEEGTAGPYTKPEYYFICRAGDQEGRSGLLEYQDYVELTAVDEADQPLAGYRYRLVLPTGEERSGALDDNGFVRVEGVPPGDYEVFLDLPQAAGGGAGGGASDSGAVSNCRWLTEDGSEAAVARAGHTVTLAADVAECPDGTSVQLEIHEADENSEDDLVTTLRAEVQSGKVATSWAYEYVEDTDEEGTAGPYTKPEYYFVCKVGGDEGRSGLLEFQDYVEITAVDESDQPLAGHTYRLVLPTGEERSGTLDENGFVRVEEVPPGTYQVFVEDQGGAAVGVQQESGAGQDAPSGAITHCRWLLEDGSEAEVARAGHTITLAADVADSPDGTAVQLEIREADENSEDDLVTTLTGEVQGGKVETSWAYEYVEDTDEEGTAGPYTKPEYYFVCKVGGDEGRSGLLEFQDFVEFTAVDDQEKPLAGRPYRLVLPSGEERTGTLDENGFVRLEEVPPGEYEVFLEEVAPPGGGGAGGPATSNQAGIAAGAPVQQDAPAGTVSNCRWLLEEDRSEATTARSGHTVLLTADVADCPDGTSAELTIREADEGSEDDLVTTLTAGVQGGRVEASWAYQYIEDTDEEGTSGPYTKPEYYFICKVGEAEDRSGLLEFQDFVEVTALDEAGQPMAGQGYRLTFPSGEERSGELDSNGFARVEGVPPGTYQISFT